MLLLKFYLFTINYSIQQMRDRTSALYTSKILHLEIKQGVTVYECYVSCLRAIAISPFPQFISEINLEEMLSLQKQIVHCLLHLNKAGQLFHFSVLSKACGAQSVHCHIDKTQC